MSELTRVKGHPGIYRKGNRYVVRWRHRGRQRSRSLRSLTDAKRFKAKVDSGETQATSRKSFRTYAHEWPASYTGRTAHGVTESTRESYKQALDRFAIPFFGTTPLDQIGPPLLREYINHLANKKGRNGERMAPASVKRTYAPVRALLGTAYDDGVLKINPAAGVRVIVPGGEGKAQRWPSPEETKKLIAEIPLSHEDLVFFLAATACRISEALSARWGDLEQFNGQTVLAIPKSKTRAGERTISLSPETVRRLTERRAGADYAADEGFIFPTRTGRRLDPDNFRHQVFNPAAQRAGIAWMTPHKLRHGLASLMAAEGYSASQIAAHLGHADGGVLALRTYIHTEVLPPVDFVDAALGSGPVDLSVDL